MRARLLLLLLLSASFAVSAQVYRGLDPNGQTVFSDRPLPDAELLELPLRRTPDEVSDETASEATEGAGFVGPYEMLEIVSPENGHRIRDPSGDLPLSLVLAPALMEGHRLVVEVDGVAADGELPNPAQILLRGLALGTHRIRALVQAGDSSTVAATPMLDVHLLRPLPDTAQP
jgi:hypothetical protein